MAHWVEWIREFGSPSGYNAETWESAHKWFVKRWIGRLQYNRSGSINLLLRRNVIAEMHRGSGALINGAQKRERRHLEVYGKVDGSASNYKQFFHSGAEFYIHCGEPVQYSEDDEMATPKIGRLEAIRLEADDVLVLELWLYTKCLPPAEEATNPLNRVADRWTLTPGPGKYVTIRPVIENLLLAPYALQPDLNDRLNCWYSCPWMEIVL